MNKIIIKMKLYALCFLISGSLIAQQKLSKLSQSIKVDKDVTIDLNTSNTNIVFDTWNKSTVEIEAYIEGEKLSKEELEEALKAWNVDIDASSDLVSIKTKGGSPVVWGYRTSDAESDAVSAMLKELKFEIADLPEMHFEMPEMPEMPEMNFEMPEMPELPELPEGAGTIAFDYGAYQKDGDKYLKEYSEKFEKLYGKDYVKKMEAWGEKFGKEWGEKYGKQMEEWAKQFEEQMNNEEFAKKMEAWGEKFGEDYAKKMEAWGERFAAQMERHAERVEAQTERTEAQKQRIQEMHEKRAALHEKATKERKEVAKEREKLAEKRRVLVEKLVNREANSNVKKTIKIKMPKGAKLKVNVRHGEIEFAANIDNLKADLSHAKFTAYSVNGSSTSINASYSPVYVTNWNLGELNLNYVEKAELKNVNHLVLNSISSNTDIENLIGTAVVDGNIGDLNILKIDDTFSNLNVILQNMNAVINLPKAASNLQYKGTRSRLSHPNKSSKDNTSTFSTGSLSSGKSIVVNAKYSNVTMQ